MRWILAWLTFSCVIVPVSALVCAYLREAKPGGHVGREVSASRTVGPLRVLRKDPQSFHYL
jgi:hypothetical protein